VTDSQEVFRQMELPFAGDRFPDALGAVVQLTVLNGLEPAREVIHAEDGSWLVGDGVNDPNAAGASTVTHIWHAIHQNSSIAELAIVPPGHMARRVGPGTEWRTEPLAWLDH